MRYRSFQELPIWQESINVGKEVYLLTDKVKFSKDYSLKDQIRRAVLSVSSNIAEGFERSNNNEFVRFLLIAKGSIGEVRSQLCFSFSLKYIDENIFKKFDKKLELLAKQIGSFTFYLKKQKKDGNFTNN